VTISVLGHKIDLILCEIENDIKFELIQGVDTHSLASGGL